MPIADIGEIAPFLKSTAPNVYLSLYFWLASTENSNNGHM